MDFDPVAHKYRNILVHCVFSTEGREDLIPAELKPRLCIYFVGVVRNKGIPVLAAEEFRTTLTG